MSYGVASAASFWKKGKTKPVRCADFKEFANERAAAAVARKLFGGYVVRRVTTVAYEIDW